LIEVDVEVQMHQAISHSNDLSPGNLRISFFGLISNAGSRFADNFNAFDQAQRPNEVSIQVAAGAL